jgi:hypothetical protein
MYHTPRVRLKQKRAESALNAKKKTLSELKACSKIVPKRTKLLSVIEIDTARVSERFTTFELTV